MFFSSSLLLGFHFSHLSFSLSLSIQNSHSPQTLNPKSSNSPSSPSSTKTPFAANISTLHSIPELDKTTLRHQHQHQLVHQLCAKNIILIYKFFLFFILFLLIDLYSLCKECSISQSKSTLPLSQLHPTQGLVVLFFFCFFVFLFFVWFYEFS